MPEPRPTSSLKQILLVLLLFAGVVIAALCYYKITRTYQPVDIKRLRPTVKKNAPLFELYNHHKPQELVRLSSYLGRHRIILVFFDRKTGVMNDLVLKQLGKYQPQLKSTSTQVFAISDALPQTNRALIKQFRKEKESPGFQFPFPLLSDPDYKIHRAYGLYDEQSQSPLQGVFIIDRLGQIEWAQTGPKRASSAPDAIQKLVEIR